MDNNDKAVMTVWFSKKCEYLTIWRNRAAFCQIFDSVFSECGDILRPGALFPRLVKEG
jgi:hypothetical protein